MVDYKIRLRNVEGKTYEQICHKFQEIMKSILDDVLRGSKPEDMVRINVHSSRFNGGDINTPFQLRSEVQDDRITSLIDKTMQSNQEIGMDDDFILNVIHVNMPLGNGGFRMRDPNMAMNLVSKRCCYTGMKDWFFGDDRDENIHCFAYSLAIGLRLMNYTYNRVRGWSKSRCQVVEEVSRLHRLAGVPPGPVGAQHYQQFQNILPPDVRLVVVDALQSKGLLFKGDSGNKIISLILYNDHYLTLKSLTGWFGVTYYCVDCEVGTNGKNSHVCKRDFSCPRCLTKRCLKLPKIPKYCDDCTGMFSGPECLDDHKTNGVCEKAKNCMHCGRWFPGEIVKHVCGVDTCSYCKKSHINGDGCFITSAIVKEVPKFRYVMFDFESHQLEAQPGEEKKEHRVNYAVAMSFCSHCGDDFCEDCSQVHHFSGLEGGDALRDFCIWATSNPLNRNSTFIAHNGGGYDCYFILEYLVREGNTPKLIMQGGKILSMTIQSTKTRFIDSLSFLSMPLSNFSKTFDLPDVTKGTFPHLFNTPDNYNYVGPLPALKYYTPDSLKEPARSNLLEWHHTHRNDRFVFADELKSYCQADVALLRAGCVKFRSSFMASTGVDPFRQVTIASTCMEVFRSRHLQPDTIGKLYYYYYYYFFSTMIR